MLAVETCFRQQRYDVFQLIPKIKPHSSSTCCDSPVMMRQSRGSASDECRKSRENFTSGPGPRGNGKYIIRTAEGKMDGQMNFLAIISRKDNPMLQVVLEEFDETISFLFDRPQP